MVGEAGKLPWIDFFDTLHQVIEQQLDLAMLDQLVCNVAYSISGAEIKYDGSKHRVLPAETAQSISLECGYQ